MCHKLLVLPSNIYVPLTQLLDHIDLNTVILGGISEEEPAVIGITLFAVTEVGLAVRLRKILLFLHLDWFKVVAFLFTDIFHLSSIKCMALNTGSVQSTGSQCKSEYARS